jgi:outer membrane receptor for ferrienterochelin and colicin
LSLAFSAVSFAQMPAPVAQEANAEEMLFMEIPNVTIASNKSENPDKSASVVSVITAEQMQRRGIRTVTEALGNLPGFYPSRQFFHDDLMGVRGYFNHTNDKIVLLIDGHNITRNG